MFAHAPSFEPVLQAIDRLSSTATVTLSRAARRTLAEVRRRLERLSIDAARLVELNNELAAPGLTIEFDQASDTVIARVDGMELRTQLRREDPSVPITMTHLTSGGAYDATDETSQTSQHAAVRRDLETLIEAYYNSAHRVLKLLASVPGLKNISCKEVTIVRNKLVEHPEPGSIYSFGYGSSGPRVKPLQKTGAEWNDDGLVPNTQAFVRAIETGVERLLSSAT